MAKAKFTEGNRVFCNLAGIGTITAVFNDGMVVRFRADNGAEFTGRPDEFVAVLPFEDTDKPAGAGATFDQEVAGNNGSDCGGAFAHASRWRGQLWVRVDFGR